MSQEQALSYLVLGRPLRLRTNVEAGFAQDRRQVQLVLTAEGQKLADTLPHVGTDALNQLTLLLPRQ